MKNIVLKITTSILLLSVSGAQAIVPAQCASQINAASQLPPSVEKKIKSQEILAVCAQRFPGKMQPIREAANWEPAQVTGGVLVPPPVAPSGDNMLPPPPSGNMIPPPPSGDNMIPPLPSDDMLPPPPSGDNMLPPPPSGNMLPPPPSGDNMLPPPPVSTGTPGGTDLLAQIRQGGNLKKVTPGTQHPAQGTESKNPGDLTGVMQSGFANIMGDRRAQMYPDHEDDDSNDSEWED